MEFVASGDINISYILIFTSIMFCMGLFGIIIKKSFIVIFMSTEIILITSVVNFIVAGNLLNNSYFHVVAMIIFALAAAEAAIGLSLFVNIFKKAGVVSIDDLNSNETGVEE